MKLRELGIAQRVSALGAVFASRGCPKTYRPHAVSPRYYTPALVAISYGVAVLAAFVALDMAARIAASERRAARWWLGLGSTAMGVGIWSMHFIGMLAFSLPIPLGYDLPITSFARHRDRRLAYRAALVCEPTRAVAAAASPAAVILGVGIAGDALHRHGRDAHESGIHYEPLWFALSIVVAIAASMRGALDRALRSVATQRAPRACASPRRS